MWGCARHPSAFQEAPRPQALAIAYPEAWKDQVAGSSRLTPLAVPWAGLRADQVILGAGPRSEGAREGAKLEQPRGDSVHGVEDVRAMVGQFRDQG